ncbi:hypothetical protein KEM56_002462 [Ascosphaera pollenicola]|nr:hypothetical protein KEM56_002462 [Ascosphaera pollenicola]
MAKFWEKTVNKFLPPQDRYAAMLLYGGLSFHKHPYNIAWRVSNLIQVPIGIAFLALSVYYPESPRFLLEKHPDEPQRALAVLAKLRGGDPEAPHVQEEWQEMLASWNIRRENPTGYMGIFKSPALRKRLLYGFFATSLQQAGGIAALTMYAVLIYQSLGWDEGSQALAINGAQACLQLVVVLVNTFTVDRFGRKTLLLFGFAIQSLALLLMSVLLSVYPNNENRPAGVAFSLSLLGQTAFLLAINQPWPDFNNKVGGKSYWLLFGLNSACFTLVLLFLPETKGVSLEKMDAIFGSVDIPQPEKIQIDGDDIKANDFEMKTPEAQQVELAVSPGHDDETPIASRKTHADLETYKV